MSLYRGSISYDGGSRSWEKIGGMWNDPEFIKTYFREYREKHKERLALYWKVYYKDNKAKINENRRKRRLLKPRDYKREYQLLKASRAK